VEKSHQGGSDSLLDYERIKWQHTLTNFGKAPDMAYQDVLEEFNLVWCVKNLLATCNNLAVTYRRRLGPGLDGHYFLKSPQFCVGSPEVVVFYPFAIERVQSVPKRTKNQKTKLSGKQARCCSDCIVMEALMIT
jgi:hypothetical protein